VVVRLRAHQGVGHPHTKASAINVTIGLAIAFMSALELWLVHDDPAPGNGRGPAVS
jgi:hypothetical protein